MYPIILYKNKIYSYFLFSITKNSFVCSSPYNKCVWPLSCLGNLLADNLTQIAIKNNKHNHFLGESIILSPSFEIYTHFHHLFVHNVEKILTLCLITFNDQMPFQCCLSSRMFVRFKSWIWFLSGILLPSSMLDFRTKKEVYRYNHVSCNNLYCHWNLQWFMCHLIQTEFK